MVALPPLPGTMFSTMTPYFSNSPYFCATSHGML
jgi:hypothetical protein